MQELKDPNSPITVSSPDLNKRHDAVADSRPMSGGIVPHVVGNRSVAPDLNPHKPGKVTVDPGTEHEYTIDLSAVNVEKLNSAVRGGENSMAVLKAAGSRDASDAKPGDGRPFESFASPGLPTQKLRFDIPGYGEVVANYHWVSVSTDGSCPSLLLAYDTRCQQGMCYFPPELPEKQIGVEMSDGTMYLVAGDIIPNRLGPFELRVLLIVDSRDPTQNKAAGVAE